MLAARHDPASGRKRGGRHGEREPTGTTANIRSPRWPPFVAVRTRFERALARRALVAVRAAARVLPGIITLADAVEVRVLMLELDNPLRGQRRWLARFAGEHRGVTLGEVYAALEALDALPAPDAHATPVALLRRHGITRRDRR
jgi:hypothetical protein